MKEEMPTPPTPDTKRMFIDKNQALNQMTTKIQKRAQRRRSSVTSKMSFEMPKLRMNNPYLNQKEYQDKIKQNIIQKKLNDKYI